MRTLTLHPSVRYLNSTLLTGGLILVSNAVGGIILARSLGASGRGFVAAAMLWPPLLAELTGLGIAQAIVFRAARSEEAAARALPAAILVGACQSLVVATCGWLLIPRVLGRMPPDVVALSQYFLFYVPLTYAVWFLTATLQARGYRFNLSRASLHFAYTALLLVLWLARLIAPVTVVAASLTSFVVAVLIGVVLVLRKHWWRPGLVRGEARALLGFGYRVQLSTIASTIASRLDLVILAALVSPTELGSYAVAGIPGAALTLLPFSASLVAYPAVVRMQLEAVPPTVARCLALFVVTIGLALLVDLTLPVVIPFLFGPGYQRAIPIGQILTFGITIRSTTSLLGAVVRGLSRPLAAGLGDVIGTLIFAVLLILMVPVWQGIGAATALFASAGVGFVVMIGVSMATTGMTARDLGPLWRRDAMRVGEAIRKAWALGGTQ